MRATLPPGLTGPSADVAAALHSLINPEDCPVPDSHTTRQLRSAVYQDGPRLFLHDAERRIADARVVLLDLRLHDDDDDLSDARAAIRLLLPDSSTDADALLLRLSLGWLPGELDRIEALLVSAAADLEALAESARQGNRPALALDRGAAFAYVAASCWRNA